MGKLAGKMIRDNTIGSNHLIDDSIISSKIGNDAIDSPLYIADDVIQSEHIVPSAILEEHLSQSAKDGVLDSVFFIGYTQIDGATAPSGTNTVNFGQLLHSNFQSGALTGGVANAGTYLAGANNRYEIRDNDTRDNIESPSNYRVYARGTTTILSLTGTTDWTISSTTLSGSSTLFTSEVNVDDLLTAPNGDIMRVSSIASDTQLTLSDVYAGASTSGETTTRDRVILSFYTYESSVETNFNMSGQIIDISMTESFEFGNMPHNAFVTGSAFSGGLPNIHTHALADISDVTSSAAEINQISDGITATATAANLSTITAGPAQDASAFHNHNSTYRTQTELSSSTGTTGGNLVGIDSSGMTKVTSDNVQGAIAELDSNAGSAGLIVKLFTAANVTVGNSFTQTLDTAPADVTKVSMFVNGAKMLVGSGNDFTITGTTVNWLATAQFDIDTNDSVEFTYFS